MATYLSQVDVLLGALVLQIGTVEIHLRNDRFAALARAIAGQQLSIAAARTIWQRFEDSVGSVDPRTVAQVTSSELRTAGLSQAKASYIVALARGVVAGSIDLDGFDGVTDDEVIRQLTRIDGVGRWTAEMFLIFSLGRGDVFSVSDAGLRRAMTWLYGLPDSASASAFEAVAQSWRPHRSAACLYLWEAVNQGMVSSGFRPGTELV